MGGRAAVTSASEAPAGIVPAASANAASLKRETDQQGPLLDRGMRAVRAPISQDHGFQCRYIVHSDRPRFLGRAELSCRMALEKLEAVAPWARRAPGPTCAPGRGRVDHRGGRQ